jgi:hypothetical protein
MWLLMQLSTVHGIGIPIQRSAPDGARSPALLLVPVFLYRSFVTAVTAAGRPSRPFILHGCHSHVAGVAWLRHGCVSFGGSIRRLVRAAARADSPRNSAAPSVPQARVRHPARGRGQPPRCDIGAVTTAPMSHRRGYRRPPQRPERHSSTTGPAGPRPACSPGKSHTLAACPHSKRNAPLPHPCSRGSGSRRIARAFRVNCRITCHTCRGARDCLPPHPLSGVF